MLTVVIPCRQDARAIGTVRALHEWGAGRAEPVEIIVCGEAPAGVTFEHARFFDVVPALKGECVRTGVLAAAGERIVVCDADLPVSTADIERLVSALDESDFALGRRHERGVPREKRRPLGRRIVSAVFRRFAIRLFGLQPDADPQCGVKAFRAEAAQQLFAEQTTPGLAYDLEVLLKARALDLKIAHVPVQWLHEGEGSTVSVWKDAPGMIAETFRLRGRYREETQPRRAVRIAILAALFLLAALTTRLLLSGWSIDPDTFFHIASGRWIVTNRAIPTTDVLSWYGQTHPTHWLPHEWLFDAGIYAVWKALGFQGVFALTSVLVGVAILCMRRLAELKGASWLASLGLAVVALVGMTRFVSPRPGVVTFVLLPLIAILLEKERWIPALLLFVLGMNLHGGTYPMYLLVILYYAPRKPWMLLVASALTLAQPLMFDLLKYPFFTLSPLADYIQEFQPTQLGSDYLFLGVLVVSWFLLDREKVRMRDLVAAAALIALSLSAVRTQAYFYLLGLPLLAPAFRLPRRSRTRATDPLLEMGEAARPAPNPNARNTAVLVALLVAALVVATQIPRGEIDVDRGYPAGALAYVQAEGITRFWNEWNDGGYIMFKGVAPFVDGRLDPFDSFFNPGTTVALEYMETYRRDNDIRPFLSKYEVEYLIVHRSTGLYQVLVQSRDFELLYEDSTASVFCFAPTGS